MPACQAAADCAIPNNAVQLADESHFSCDDGACASDTLESSVEVSAPPKLTSYALGGHVDVTITVAGPLPTQAWVANLRVCMSGTARASVGF